LFSSASASEMRGRGAAMVGSTRCSAAPDAASDPDLPWGSFIESWDAIKVSRASDDLSGSYRPDSLNQLYFK
jgi:hypothetical protein